MKKILEKIIIDGNAGEYQSNIEFCKTNAILNSFLVKRYDMIFHRKHFPFGFFYKYFYRKLRFRLCNFIGKYRIALGNVFDTIDTRKQGEDKPYLREVCSHIEGDKYRLEVFKL